MDIYVYRLTLPLMYKTAFLFSAPHPARNHHLSALRSLQPVDAQMLPPVPPNIYPKRIPRRLSLPILLRAHQSSHQIRLGLWRPERVVRQQWALVQEAEMVGQRVDAVGKVPLASRPDDEEGKRVDTDKDAQGVVGWHGGRDADLGLFEELCGEDPAGEDGDGERHQTDEGYPGNFEVTVGQCEKRDLDRVTAWICKQETVFGGGTSGTAKVRERLCRAEVGVDRLPGEEQNHAEERRDEAEEEVGG